MTAPTLPAPLQNLLRSLREAADAQACFVAAEHYARDRLGTRLFTVLRHFPDKGQIERCYSSDPDRFTTGVRKDMGPTEWGSLVLHRGESWFGNAAAIRATFPDAERILAAGHSASICVPIRHAGETLAVLSLAAPEEIASPQQIAEAELLAGLLCPALLQAA